MNHVRNQRGFTIIELIVAVAVTVLMLLLINQLFNDTSRAVSAGVGLSDVIGNERAMVDQIAKDGAAMRGPASMDASTGAGLMIILNELIPNVEYAERNAKTGMRDVRADGLLFIARRHSGTYVSELPMSPGGPGTYDTIPPEKMAFAASNMRVYYGHGLKTSPDGLTSLGNLGSGGQGTANNWVLVRHALFIVGRETGTAPADPPPGFPRDARGAASSNGVTHSAPVQRFGTADGKPLYQGYTDVADIAFSGTGNPTGAVFGSNQLAGGALIYSSTDGNQSNKVPKNDYDTAAMQLMFTGAQRMWTNPRPVLDRTDPYKSEQMAQMHNLWATNVSDFIVEFAADTDFDPDGLIEVDGSGNIRWFSKFDLPTYPGTFPVGHAKEGQTVISPIVADGFVFRHDFPEHWPKMIRIRYRLHDPRASVHSEDPGEDNPVNPSAPGAGTKNGKWFEHIIRAPRPE